MELPGGRLDQATRELTVRTLGRVTDPEDFNNIVIATKGGYAVKIRDVGYAEDSAEEPRSAAYLNANPSVTLVVSKQSGENTVAVAKAIKQRVQELKSTLPGDFRMQVISDQSVFIEASVNSIKQHLIEGSFLACAVIFIFLANIRTTIIAATAIPISIISTFALMAAIGYTLNQITMLALTLMVGIVIDDAIIVLENIYRFIEEKGMKPFEAAIEGTKEIGLAVTATTLSLLAVFVPVGFMGGIVGRFMSSFGLTSAFAIAVSAFVSFTLTPMLTSRWIKPREEEEKGGKRHSSSKESRIFKPIDRNYTKLLEWSMAHRKAVVTICGLVVLSTVPLFMLIGKNFLPADDRSEYEVTIRTPEGSTLAATASVTRRIAAEIRELPGINDTLATIGGGATGTVNSAGIYIRLTDMDKRDLSQQQLMVKTRAVLERYAGDLRTSVQPISSVGGGARNADVQYAISGPSIEKLDQYSQALMAKLRSMPQATDVDSSLVAGKPEIQVEIDRARAADLGVRVGDIAQALNTLIAGQDVTTFTAGTDQYNVRMRAIGEFRTSPETLKRIVVGSTERGSVTLDQVVKIEQGVGPSAIERLNRQRQVTVCANLKPGGSQADVLSELNSTVAGMNLPPAYRTQLAGASKELGRTGYYFVLAFGLSFIFMYIVLAAQFESFIHPVTILLTLPLAIPFGILSLLIMGQTVNIFSGLGLLLLFGIVKKNAILQIDHTNGLRQKGMERHEAIIQSNRDRLRPILMTTIALVAGMLPLVISTGPGAATNRSIGVLVVGGQTLCLLLTLLAVPVFYSLFDDAKDLPLWRRIGDQMSAVSGWIKGKATNVLDFGKAAVGMKPAQLADARGSETEERVRNS